MTNFLLEFLGINLFKLAIIYNDIHKFIYQSFTLVKL